MRFITLCTVVTLILALNIHAQDSRPTGTVKEADWKAPAIEMQTSVRRGRDGEVITWEKLIEELSAADAVFLGETHIDETTHRVEHAIYQRLLAARQKNVVLSVEMFERDTQAVLDRYLSGQINEREFRRSARPWSNYQTAYRPLIEMAKAAGKPVVAANFPRAMRRILGQGGLEGLKALKGEEKKQVPAEVLPNTKAYWRRVDNAVRGHLAMMRPQAGDDQRLLTMQTLWDNAMGESVALALDANPGHSVLHVVGGFHTAYWGGTVRQFKLRKPEASILTVDISATSNPQTARLSGKPRADYVIYAEARARDLNEGMWAVHTDREIEYLLHMPRNLEPGTRVPLFVWFPEDGLTAEDGMRLWKSRIGDEAAIAVIDSPYPAVQFDMGRGGRWFWPDRFAEDIGSLNHVVERTWAYLCRYYPVDPRRVVVAGEGAGATVAATAAIRSDRMDLSIVAFGPRQYAKIKDFPLPLPELRGDDPATKKMLHMVLAKKDQDWWGSELKEYEAIGIQSRVIQAVGDAWKREHQHENLVRQALGLKASEAAADTPRKHIVLDGGSARARYWARLRALKEEGAHVAVLTKEEAESAEGSELLATTIEPLSYKKPFALPRCPGPFGGTTVVVLPQDIDEAAKNAWIEVLDAKPISRVSRFHRLRLAFPDGEHGLAQVLEELRGQGRKNVLIIPAAFCADAATMQSLAARTEAVKDQMTIHWSPGLGAR